MKANNFSEITEEWARIKPNAVAINDDKKQITFLQLENASRELLIFLSYHKLSGKRVIVLTQKNAELLISIFAILKSGGSYVPLDQDLPSNRINEIIDEIEPELIVGPETSFLSHDPRFISYRTVRDFLEKVWGLERLIDVPLPKIKLEDTCYIIYTSGSTGRAKGVQICHDNVMSYFQGMRHFIDDREGDKYLNTLPFHFDGSIGDTFLALYLGRPIYLTPAIPFPNLISNKIRENNLTHITIAASVLSSVYNVLIENSSKLQSLRCIITGAEVCSVDVINSLIERFENLTIVNGYGPTEATCDSLAFMINRSNVKKDTSSYYPIGKPLKHVQALLSKEDPSDRIGELLLSGRQVFKSYFKREEETNVAFILLDSILYYKTGDLCEVDENGNYIYVGRKDDEVKISGYRIHLSELKRVTNSLPYIKKAEVFVSEEKGAKILCLIFESNEIFDDENFIRLRTDISQLLPKYMLPARYLNIDEIPMSPNMKLDKNKTSRLINKAIEEYQSVFLSVRNL